MAKATTASTTAAGKDAEKVQAVENTTTEEKAAKTANTQSETVKLIYINNWFIVMKAKTGQQIFRCGERELLHPFNRENII